MGGFRVNQEFFDNVRVPKEALVGEENKGFLYMFTQLAHERLNLVPHSMSVRAIEDTVRWARATKRNGVPVDEEPWEPRLALVLPENSSVPIVSCVESHFAARKSQF